MKKGRKKAKLGNPKKVSVSKLRKGIRGLVKLVGNGKNRRLEIKT